MPNIQLEINPFTKLWNKALYGWDLNHIVTGELKLMLDVSHWVVIPSQFDEQKFVEKAQALGLSGLIYKISDADKGNGRQFYDSTAEFWFNLIQKLKSEYGMNVVNGGYHWLQQSVDPKSAFDFHNTWVRDHPSRLPYICDFEEPSITSATDYLWRLQEWFKHADANNPSGEVSICYTGMGYVSKLKSMLGSAAYQSKMSWMSSYTLWLARYSRYSPDMTSLWPWNNKDWKIWQYSPHADWPYFKDEDNKDGLNWGLQAHGIDMNWAKREYLDYYLGLNVPLPPDEPQPPAPAEPVIMTETEYWAERIRLDTERNKLLKDLRDSIAMNG